MRTKIEENPVESSAGLPLSETEDSGSNADSVDIEGSVELNDLEVIPPVRLEEPEPVDALEAAMGHPFLDATPVEETAAPTGGTPDESSFVQTPPATLGWGATGVQYGFPADAQISVSSSHVIVSGRQTIGFFARNGTVVKGPFAALDFFAPLGLDDGTANAITRYNDLRTLFDPYRRRFWVLANGGNPQTYSTDPAKTRPVLAFGVSKTENPMDGWYLYWTYAVAHWGLKDGVYQPGDSSDYPRIGIDPFAIHITNKVANAVTKDSRYHKVTFFPAAPLAAGTFKNGWQFWDLKNPDGSMAGPIQPVVHHGSTDRAFYVSRYKSDKVLVWTLTNPLTSSQKMSRTQVSVKSFTSPVNAPQKGSTKLIKTTNLKTGPVSAAYRSPFLYVVFNDAHDWFGDGQVLSSIRLLRMSVSGLPDSSVSESGFFDRTFGKNSSIDDPADAHIHYAWPAVEVNKNRDVIVVYARSGKTIFPEVRFTVLRHNESDVSPSRLLQSGKATYNPTGAMSPLPWGDTGGACVDPVDDTGIWMAQQYATTAPTDNNFEIWVGKALS
jgi:hypothetical protein